MCLRVNRRMLIKVLKCYFDLPVGFVGNGGSLVVIRVADVAVGVVSCVVAVDAVKGNLGVVKGRCVPSDGPLVRDVVVDVARGVVAAVVDGDADAVSGTEPAFVPCIRKQVINAGIQERHIMGGGGGSS